MPPPRVKFSEIAPFIGAHPNVSDQVLGVVSGNTDNLFNFIQISATISGLLPVFAGSSPGFVPTSPGGSTLFLNANGNWVNASSITLAGENYLSLAGTTITAHPVDLSSTNVTANLPVTHLNNGTGASGTTFWRGDGTWSVPTTTLAVGNPLTGGSAGQVLYDTGGTLGEYNAAGITNFLNIFTTLLKGLVPAPGAGSGTRFLREDVSWQVPPGSGGAPPGGPTSAVQFNAGFGSFGGSANFEWDGTSATITGGDIKVRDIYTSDTTFLHRTLATLATMIGSSVATLNNCPSGGDPVTWLEIDNNGQTLIIPAWLSAPTLDFSIASNSQYLPIFGLGV